MILSEFEQNQDLMKDSNEFGVSAQGQRRLRDPHTKKWFPVQVIYFKKIFFIVMFGKFATFISNGSIMF